MGGKDLFFVLHLGSDSNQLMGYCKFPSQIHIVECLHWEKLPRLFRPKGEQHATL